MKIISDGFIPAGFLSGKDAISQTSESLKAVCEFSDASFSRILFPKQIHSNIILEDKEGEGDGIITSTPGTCACIKTADCFSVAAADTPNNVFGIFHSGWRGTVKNILGEGISAMKKYGASEISAVIFPGIEKCCFEIGPELVPVFKKNKIPVEKKRDQLFADIKSCIKNQLEKSGVKNIKDLSVCTCCNEKFYSYRRNGTSKRHLSFIIYPE